MSDVDDATRRRTAAVAEYRKKLLQHKELESRVRTARENLRGAKKEFNKTEDDLKSLQSVGQISRNELNNSTLGSLEALMEKNKQLLSSNSNRKTKFEATDIANSLIGKLRSESDSRRKEVAKIKCERASSGRNELNNSTLGSLEALMDKKKQLLSSNCNVVRTTFEPSSTEIVNHIMEKMRSKSEW